MALKPSQYTQIERKDLSRIKTKEFANLYIAHISL
jgi:hypothetical protein